MIPLMVLPFSFSANGIFADRRRRARTAWLSAVLNAEKQRAACTFPGTGIGILIFGKYVIQ
jgi:hypothetical protein